MDQSIVRLRKKKAFLINDEKKRHLRCSRQGKALILLLELLKPPELVSQRILALSFDFDAFGAALAWSVSRSFGTAFDRQCECRRVCLL
jgi:hypothetical protein